MNQLSIDKNNKSISFDEVAILILKYVGGLTNIDKVTNCNTRLRLLVKDNKIVNIDKLKKIPNVLGIINYNNLIQIVIGPSNVKIVADKFNNLLVSKT